MTLREIVRRSAFVFTVAILLFGGAGASGVFAQDLRWSYVEGGWLLEDSDDVDSENCWFGGGTIGLKRFHFFGEYRDTGGFESWETGGGWHGLFGDQFDLVAEAAYVDLEFDEGYRASGGFRWMMFDDIEVNAFYNHVDVGEFENDSVSVGGNWEFLKRLAVGGEWEWGDEADSGRAYLRFYFQKD